MITLRPIAMSDAARLYEWAMAPETRAQSFRSGTFDFESHCRWLTKRLASPDWMGLVAEDNGGPVGMIRFDRQDDRATPSFVVAPESRGKGYGTAILAAGARHVRATGFASRIWGCVKLTNPASLQCFEKAGFARREDSVVNGVRCAVFEWPA
jgi:RimJ/RimL family protein N-acetyltransferase